jgi:hypothetical protein
VKSSRFDCLTGPSSAKINRLQQSRTSKLLNSENLSSEGPPMKRSRRVVLTMMGTAAVGAVSVGFVQRPCGPGLEAVPGLDGRPYCRAVYGGFGGAPHRFHGHGHGHGHGG